MRTARPVFPVLLCLLATPLVGCSGATADVDAEAHGHGHDHDHDHGDRPESLHAAVAMLTETRDALRDAILNGDPDDAHDPLHEVVELLEAIPDIAAETDLPKEAWDTVNAANDKLFETFGAIDKAFHTKDGDKKAAYEGVAEQLDEAIESIRSQLALSGEEPPADHDHDHDNHDHDDHEGHDHDETDAADSEDAS
ncbi:MAG: hypothetical protein AAF266_00460 [Planctomycetota bacterium]